jgi:hypothetical protein
MKIHKLMDCHSESLLEESLLLAKTEHYVLSTL